MLWGCSLCEGETYGLEDAAICTPAAASRRSRDARENMRRLSREMGCSRESDVGPLTFRAVEENMLLREGGRAPVVVEDWSMDSEVKSTGLILPFLPRIPRTDAVYDVIYWIDLLIKVIILCYVITSQRQIKSLREQVLRLQTKSIKELELAATEASVDLLARPEPVRRPYAPTSALPS
ncbi:hypothetical protein HDV05_006663 [Chytridiales sp. JEL 0842]|nr:hypothetical protein HDV05_006663 [Chytridiales sp. JEL 0842]